MGFAMKDSSYEVYKVNTAKSVFLSLTSKYFLYIIHSQQNWGNLCTFATAANLSSYGYTSYKLVN